MASSVESRVVSLKFDNGQFMDGVKSTLDGLNRLKEGLAGKLGGEKLAELGDEAKKVDLKKIGEDAQQVGASISLMAAAGAVALGNLASRAVETGLAFAQKLTVQPLIDGFREYELQLNSVQTILANTQAKGETLSTVSAALDELNVYADKTIYNFGQMTANIGKFTAAGVGLSDSVSAIKGLSNLAAMFGVDAASASNAMYQLSQAISSGVVRLQDWNSVQNAGMGGEAFQEALIRTARIHGEAVDEAIEKNGSFRESLKENWLTAEVMLSTLSQFTGDLTDDQLLAMGYTEEQIEQIQTMAQSALEAATYYKTFSQVVDAVFEVMGSGWANVWRILMGDFEEAQAFWTSVGNYITGVIDNLFNGISGVAQRFVDLGGKAAIIAGLGNIFEAIRKPLNAVGQAFNDTFKTDFGHILANIAKAFERLTTMFIMSDENLAKLRTTFQGLWSILHIILWPITQAWKLFAFLGEALIGLTGIVGGKGTSAFLSLTAAIAKGPIAIDEWLHKFDPMGKLVDWLRPKLQSFVEWIGPKLSNAATTAKEAFEKVRSAIGDRISSVLTTLADTFSRIATTLGDFFAPKVQKAREALSEFSSSVQTKVAEKFAKLGEKAREAGEIFSDVFSGRTANVTSKFGEVVEKVANALHKAYDWAIEFGKGLLQALEGKGPVLMDKLGTAADWISDKLGGLFKNEIKIPDVANSEQVQSAMTSVQTTAETASTNAQSAWEKFTSWWNTSFMPYIQSVWSAVSPVLTEIWEALKQFASSFKNAFTFEEGDFGLARLLNYLVTGGVLAIFYNITSTLKTTFSDVSETLESLKATLESFNEALEAHATEAKSRALKNYATALLILAAALFILALIPASRLQTASTAIILLAAALVIMMESLDKVGMRSFNMVALGAALVGFALAIALIAGAAALMALVDPESINRALNAIMLIIAMMTAAAKGMDDIHVNPTAGLAMIGFAASLYIIAGTVHKLGSMDAGTLAKGIAAVSVITLVMGVYQKLAKNPMGMGNAVALLALALFLQKVSATIVQLGEMDWDTARQGVTVLTVVIAALAIALKSSENVDFSNALGIMAGIVLMLAIGHVIEQLAAIAWTSCLKAVITIGVVLLELGLAMSYMNNKLEGSAAIFLAAAALTLIGNVVAKLSALSWTQLKIGLIGLAGALAIVLIAGKLGQSAALGLIILAAAIGSLGLVLTAIGTIITGVTTLLTVAAIFGAPAFIALAHGIELLAATIPTVITSVFDGVLLLSKLIWDNKETLAKGIAGIFIAMSEAIVLSTPSIFEALGVLLENLLAFIVEYSPQVADAAYQLMIAMANKIIEYMPTIAEKGGQLVIAFCREMAKQMPAIVEAAILLIIAFIDALANAIRDNTPALENALHNLIDAMGSFMRRQWESFKTWGADVVKGIAQGVSDNAWRVVPSIGSVALKLGSTIKNKLGISSPSKVFAEYGKFVVMGLAIGIAENAKLASDASGEAADGIVNEFNKAIRDGIFDELENEPLTIAPVLDLTNVRSGLDELGAQGISLQAQNASTIGTRPDIPIEQTPPNQLARAQVVYNQTINSPDPLSEAEIYRRTRNLVSATVNR